MLDMTKDDAGVMPVKVKVRGFVTDRDVDVYAAHEVLVAALPADGEAVKVSQLHELAVRYFDAEPADFTLNAAKQFWEAVVERVKELGKGESASGKPS